MLSKSVANRSNIASSSSEINTYNILEKCEVEVEVEVEVETKNMSLMRSSLALLSRIMSQNVVFERALCPKYHGTIFECFSDSCKFIILVMNIIVNFAPTGMIPTKEMSPHVPISVNEIVEDVHEACEIGITMVHLHAREERTGNATYRGEVYRDIIERIRKFASDLIVCVSLSGRMFIEFEKRSEPLQLDGKSKPDMGSLTLSSLNFNRQESVNPPDLIHSLAREMKHRGILPELEAFDTGMINYAKYLEKKGLIEPPHYFNLILGNIACAQADLLHAGLMINDLPPDSYWSLGGVGNMQLKVNSLSIIYGGGVRIGLEDNIWLDKGRSVLARNADLLRRIHTMAELHERKIMASQELRGRLNLQSGDGSYGRLIANENPHD